MEAVRRMLRKLWFLARRGRFSDDLTEEMAFHREQMEKERQTEGLAPESAHYSAAYGSILFNRSLRQKIVFSDHSLASDAGFAEMQLISCRNVLIYFDRPLQNRALGLFHESLCRRGFLGLGSRETLRFTDLDKEYVEVADRWYQRC